MSFVAVMYIMLGPIALIGLGVCIWFNTKSGRRWLRGLPEEEEE
jgi:hypothetical protein